MEGLSLKKFLERGFLFKEEWIPIKYTKHSIERFENRKGGQFYVLPSLLNLQMKMVRKIYMNGDRIVKYKIRIHYNEKQWLCLILTPSHICKTLWWEDKIKNNDRQTGDVSKNVELKKSLSYIE